MLISRVSRRISSGTVGRPPRGRDFQRQYDLSPARCQRTIVSGFTIANASRALGNNRYRPTNINRSIPLKESFFGAVLRKTLICCRNVQISASSAARERIRSTTIQPISLQRSLMAQQHRPILCLSPARWGFRQGQAKTLHYRGFCNFTKSRTRKFEQDAKWSFCLTAGTIGPRIRRDHEQATAPEPLTGLQGEGGPGRRQRRPDDSSTGRAL